MKKRKLVVLFRTGYPSEGFNKEATFAAVVVDGVSKNSEKLCEIVMELAQNFRINISSLKLNEVFARKGLLGRPAEEYSSYERTLITLASITKDMSEKTKELFCGFVPEKGSRYCEYGTLLMDCEEIEKAYKECDFYAEVYDRTYRGRVELNPGTCIKFVKLCGDNLVIDYEIQGKVYKRPRTHIKTGPRKISDERIYINKDKKPYAALLTLDQFHYESSVLDEKRLFNKNVFYASRNSYYRFGSI